jgi:hypothetical protein
MFVNLIFLREFANAYLRLRLFTGDKHHQAVNNESLTQANLAYTIKQSWIRTVSVFVIRESNSQSRDYVAGAIKGIKDPFLIRRK